MAAKKKTQKVITSGTAEKAVDIAINSLADLATSTYNAIIVVDKENKKLAAEAKRLGKKRAVLLKKKKTATNKLKKDASAINKKALKSIEKDIAATRKDVARIATQKAVVSDELTTLKAVSKRAVAYDKAVAMADRTLNKPKKKVRRKKAVKKAPATISTLAIVA